MYMYLVQLYPIWYISAWLHNDVMFMYMWIWFSVLLVHTCTWAIFSLRRSVRQRRQTSLASRSSSSVLSSKPSRSTPSRWWKSSLGSTWSSQAWRSNMADLHQRNNLEMVWGEKPLFSTGLPQKRLKQLPHRSSPSCICGRPTSAENTKAVCHGRRERWNGREEGRLGGVQEVLLLPEGLHQQTRSQAVCLSTDVHITGMQMCMYMYMYIILLD